MSDRTVKDAWVARVLGVAPPPPSGDGAGEGLAGWQAARAKVIGQLKALEGKIKGMGHPRGAAAIVLVRSIQMNLSPVPDGRRGVAELERFLSTDDVIADAERPNGFGITVEIRKPLLAALDRLKAGLPS